MDQLRILIADDSEKLLSALRLQLERFGFDVIACADAYMALAQAQKYRPDVMVLDIRMPAGDGFSVLERMRKIPELCNTPVIYVTGEASLQLDLKAEQLGARGIIHKPIKLSALLKLIDAVVGDRHQRGFDIASANKAEVFDVSPEITTSHIGGRRYDPQ